MRADRVGAPATLVTGASAVRLAGLADHLGVPRLRRVMVAARPDLAGPDRP